MQEMKGRLARLEQALDTLMLEVAAARDLMDVVIAAGSVQQEANLLLPAVEVRRAP